MGLTAVHFEGNEKKRQEIQCCLTSAVLSLSALLVIAARDLRFRSLQTFSRLLF